jgi:hypothetical protein
MCGYRTMARVGGFFKNLIQPFFGRKGEISSFQLASAKFGIFGERIASGIILGRYS